MCKKYQLWCDFSSNSFPVLGIIWYLFIDNFPIVFQELYIVKTAAATFCFYALTVTLPNVSFGLVSRNGMPKFLNIVSMAWIGIALQPIVFFATNRKFRVHVIAVICCRDPPDAETTGSLRGRSTRTSSSTSRPSRISFPDLRTLLGVLPQSIRDKAFLKERGPSKSNDNLQTVSELQEPLTVTTNLWWIVCSWTLYTW